MSIVSTMGKRIALNIILYAILIVIGIITAPACVDLSSIEDTVRDTIRDEFSEEEENLGDCRKYPAVSITNGSTVQNCTFDIAARKYSCVAGTVTTEKFYSSVQSFVEEDDRYFRDFAEWARITDTSATPNDVTIVLYTRNTDNQITNILYQRIEGAAAPLEEKSITYTAWDGRNRPTTGTMTTSDGTDTCTDQNVSVEYDSDARTKTEAISGGTDTGSYCVESTTVTTLNSAGLVISEVENFTVSSATDTDLIDNTDIGEVCEKEDVPEPPVEPSAGTLSFQLVSAGQDVNILVYSGSTIVARTDGDVTLSQDGITTLEAVDTDGAATGENASLNAGNYDVYLRFIGDSTGALLSYEVDGDKIYQINAGDYTDGLIDPSVDWGISATGNCSWLRVGADATDTAATFATCTGTAATNCATTGVNLVATVYDVYCEATASSIDYSGRLSSYLFDTTASDEPITLTEVP